MKRVVNKELLPKEIRRKAYRNPGEAYLVMPSGIKCIYLPGRGYFCYGYQADESDTRFLTERTGE